MVAFVLEYLCEETGRTAREGLATLVVRFQDCLLCPFDLAVERAHRETSFVKHCSVAREFSDDRIDEYEIAGGFL